VKPAPAARTLTRTVRTEAGPVPVTLTDRGAGRPVLLLHGGGGPGTVEGFAGLLAARGSRVLTPVHPGFEGTGRPAGLDSVAALARLYAGLVADLGLRDVTVVGNSLGGWITAEMAVAPSPAVSGHVLDNTVGLVVESAPLADFFALTPDQVAEYAYRDPDRFRVDPAALPAQRRAAMAANRETLRVYGGTSMADPALRGRLPRATAPSLVVWGTADRLAPVEHGNAYAEGLPGARLALLPDAGHLPQLETPEALARLVEDFAAAH